MRGILIIISLLFLASCGVKGDPIPPGDPEMADSADAEADASSE